MYNLNLYINLNSQLWFRNLSIRNLKFLKSLTKKTHRFNLIIQKIYIIFLTNLVLSENNDIF
jgi:hypothetical protein